MAKGYKDLVADAEAAIVTLSIEEAKALHGRPDVQFVDVRDVRELERDGMVPNAIHVPRGMLEFWIDPESPYHKAVFAEPKQFIFYCAGGMRSALAAKTAQEMGLADVAHVGGGFDAWRDSGNRVAERPKRPRSGE